MEKNQSIRISKMRRRLGLEPEPEKPKPRPRDGSGKGVRLSKARLSKDSETIDRLHENGEITTTEYQNIKKRLEALQKDIAILKDGMDGREIGVCAGCEDRFDREELMTHRNGSDLLCEDCRYHCYWCDDVLTEDEAFVTESGEHICEGCMTNCPLCDSINHPDELEENTDTGDYVCEDCYSQWKEEKEEEESEREREEEGEQAKYLRKVLYIKQVN